MFKIRIATAAAIAGAVTVLSSGAAQAYPDPPITITIDDATVVGGTTFSYTADSGSVDCDWTITYAEAVNGSEKQTGSGTSTSGTFDTKVVGKTSASSIKAVCRYGIGTEPSVAKVETSATASSAIRASTRGTALKVAIQSASASATTTLLAKGAADDDGVLPDTGGSNLWILAVGGALLVGGAGLTVASRRRTSSR